jgi:6-phosphogluconolactonase
MKSLLTTGIILINLTVHATSIYIGTIKSTGIFHTQLNSNTGELTPIQQVASIKNPTFLAIDPQNNRLFAAEEGRPVGEIVGFQIQSNAKLIEINRRPINAQRPCHLYIDTQHHTLLTANYREGSIESFRIQSDGALSSSVSHHQHTGSGSHPTRQKKPHAHAIIAHPSQPFVYAADLGANALFSYRLDPETSRLTPLKKNLLSTAASGPRHMKWDHTGNHLLVLNELDISLTTFRFNPDGSLTELSNTPALPDGTDLSDLTAAEIRLHPQLPLIYCSIRDKTDQQRDAITLFSITPDTVNYQNTYPAHVHFPRNFNIDPTGKWLIIAGQRSHDLAVLQLSTNGIPRFSGHRYSFPGEPVCIAFHHSTESDN